MIINIAGFLPEIFFLGKTYCYVNFWAKTFLGGERLSWEVRSMEESQVVSGKRLGADLGTHIGEITQIVVQDTKLNGQIKQNFMSVQNSKGMHGATQIPNKCCGDKKIKKGTLKEHPAWKKIKINT